MDFALPYPFPPAATVSRRGGASVPARCRICAAIWSATLLILSCWAGPTALSPWPKLTSPLRTGTGVGAVFVFVLGVVFMCGSGVTPVSGSGVALLFVFVSGVASVFVSGVALLFVFVFV